MRSMNLDTSDMSTSLEALAEALGANYDSMESTIYKGSDSHAGFNIEFDSANGFIRIRLFDDSYAIDYSGSSATIYYEVSESCCVFGMECDYSGISKLQCAIVPYSSSAGSGYLHIIRKFGM